MNDIKKQLDKIKNRFSDEKFLSNKGLSNEVGIHVFSYDPRDEIIVRDFINRIVNDPSSRFKVVEMDIYEIILEVLQEKRVLSNIEKMEERKGKEYLLNHLQKIATEKEIIKKMEHVTLKQGNIILLSGIGKAYPFMRAHKILESMQIEFYDVPIVMFYPGIFNGNSLDLFTKFHDGNYYRAFNLL